MNGAQLRVNVILHPCSASRTRASLLGIRGVVKNKERPCGLQDRSFRPGGLFVAGVHVAYGVRSVAVATLLVIVSVEPSTVTDFTTLNATFCPSGSPSNAPPAANATTRSAFWLRPAELTVPVRTSVPSSSTLCHPWRYCQNVLIFATDREGSGCDPEKCL